MASYPADQGELMRKLSIIFIIVLLVGIAIGATCKPPSCGAESDRWYSPVSYNETISENWTDPSFAYDDEWLTVASYDIEAENWTSYFELLLDEPIYSTQVRLWIEFSATADITLELGVYSVVGAEWVSLYSEEFFIYSDNDAFFHEFSFPNDNELLINKLRIRIYNFSIEEWATTYIHEVDVWGRYEENIGEQGEAGINGTAGEQGPAGPQGPAGSGEANNMPLWYILGLAALAVGSWFSQSIVVNIMLMIFCAGGFELTDLYLTFSQPLYYSIRGVLILGIVFALLQLFTRVKHI